MEKWEIPKKILNRSCPKFAWVITSEPLLLCKISSRYDYSLSPPNMRKCATSDSAGFLFWFNSSVSLQPRLMQRVLRSIRQCINTLWATTGQWMAIKCIPQVQQLIH